MTVEPTKIIYSKRKTLSMEIKEAKLIIRAPKGFSQRKIDKFIVQKSDWIKKHLSKQAQEIQEAKNQKIEKISSEEKEIVKNFIHQRLDHLSQETRLKYTRFTLSKAKTSWGVCTGKNAIRINWKLYFAPPEVLDYVIIHELCHIKHKNHSKRFWSLVESFDPNFKANRKWLKDNKVQLEVIE